MLKYLGELMGLVVLGFFVWVVMSTNPTERLERVCSPIDWTGNLAVSLVALTWPVGQEGTRDTFDRIDYGCQYTLWRMFYESDYLKKHKAVPDPAPKSKLDAESDVSEEDFKAPPAESVSP